MKFFVIVFLFFFAASTQAAKFTNQFVEFELPPQWQCVLEGAEWVCQNAEAGKKKDAIIVLAGKLRGAQDSLDQYLEFLKKSKTFNSVQNRSVTSKPSYAKFRVINDQTWVDALHQDSEIPGYYTRYFATIKLDIGVLVTYSVEQSKYKDYVQVFENLLNTLKVFRRPGPINAQNKNHSLLETTNVPENVLPTAVFPTAEEPAPVAKQEDDLPLPYIIGGVAVILFILWRRRKKED